MVGSSWTHISWGWVRIGLIRCPEPPMALCLWVGSEHCDGCMRILMRDATRGVDVERRCPWCNEVGMQECAECG